MDTRTKASHLPGADLSPMHMPRYMGLPTFMRAPWTDDLNAVDVALVGVPFDGGVSNRPGARHGPREMRNMSSMMRTMHHIFHFSPFDVCRVADVGDVPFTSVYDLSAVNQEIAAFFATLANNNVSPVTAGGDHSITYPILKGLVSSGPVGLVHVDAHTDTWDEFMGSRFHHGGPFRLAVEANLIDPKRTVQIGIRGAQNTTEGWEYSHEKGMRVIFMEEFTERGVESVVQEVRQIIGDDTAYLSFDVDALDPAFAPGTGTPEIGGMTTREALSLVHGLRGLNFLGGDVVEVSPPFDNSGNTALVGATMMYEILCLVAESKAKATT